MQKYSEDWPMNKIHLVAAARPNFMKVAPLYHALAREAWCDPVLVHTGQHYDANMSQTFLDELNLPAPHAHLDVRSGTHAEQTARILESYEKLLLDDRPDWVVVPGDVNSTLACALAAAKLHIPVAHLEAGLRSNDRTMPEELNRILTDAISDLLLTPSPDADENLLREGVDPAHIIRIGNIMIDAFEMLRKPIEQADTLTRFGMETGEYIVATLHRPANVDSKATLGIIVGSLNSIAESYPIILPLHPRTKARMTEFGMLDNLAPGVRTTEPLGYVQFMNLVMNSFAVITDSGGVQEETSYLRIPCITLRENTERPITVSQGTNRLASIGELARLITLAYKKTWPQGQPIEFWDGKTASRCVTALSESIRSSSCKGNRR
jgi:UDP-N-acetylglucosamine 2-epimerase (non-hydrolysing)